MEPLLRGLQLHHKKIGDDAERSLGGRSHQAGHGEGGMMLDGKRWWIHPEAINLYLQVEDYVPSEWFSPMTDGTNVEEKPKTKKGLMAMKKGNIQVMYFSEPKYT